MYLPEKFKEIDLKKIKNLIDAYPLGLLIICDNNEPIINTYPFIYELVNGSDGTLIAHMSKDSDQYKLLTSCASVSVIFNGPQGYISPSWYESAGVPTWNYTTVQIQGKPKLIASSDVLVELLENTTSYFESEYANPWKYQADKKTSHLLDMIVGFEIEVTKIDAKFKLSQNRPQNDQINIIKKLSESRNHQAIELSQWMKKYYD